MTVVAYKDGIVAADSLVTVGGIRVAFEDKLWVHEGSTFAAAGRSESVIAFRHWLCAGRPMARPTIDPSFTGLELTTDGRVLRYEEGLLALPQPATSMVGLGAGGEIALGAMAAGASAERAALIACELHVGCGPPVRAIRVW